MMFTSEVKLIQFILGGRKNNYYTSISIVNEKIHTLMAFYDDLEFQCDPLLINSYAFGYLILQNS